MNIFSYDSILTELHSILTSTETFEVFHKFLLDHNLTFEFIESKRVACYPDIAAFNVTLYEESNSLKTYLISNKHESGDTVLCVKQESIYAEGKIISISLQNLMNLLSGSIIYINGKETKIPVF